MGCADALRAVRSLALSCTLAGSSAFWLHSVAGGDLSTWLAAVACAYVAGVVGAHALCMLAVRFYSGQAGATAAAYDSYKMRPSPARNRPIEDTGFYQYYNGHEVRDLRFIHQGLRTLGCRSFLFLAGDSSFDNKHWFFRKGKATVERSRQLGLNRGGRDAGRRHHGARGQWVREGAGAGDTPLPSWRTTHVSAHGQGRLLLAE